MKKLILVLTVMLSLGAFAQKGSFYVGGQAGFSSSETKKGSFVERDLSSWSFSPEFGTFLTNNVQLGVGLKVSGGTSNYFGTLNNSVKNENNNFGAVVYSRYFFGEGSKVFRPFVGVNVDFLPGSEKTTQTTTTASITSKSDTFLFGTNLNAGFAYALTSKVTVVGSLGVLGFSSYKTTPENGDATKTNSFGFDLNSLGNRFNIGMYLTL